nr:hypothetical protein [Tanacetum cinerariifolium]
VANQKNGKVEGEEEEKVGCRAGSLPIYLDEDEFHSLFSQLQDVHPTSLKKTPVEKVAVVDR